MVSTSGYPTQELPIKGFTPADPSLVAGYNFRPFAQGVLSQLDIAQQATKSKELANIEPSEERETIAANNLNAKEKNYLASVSPLAAIAIDKGNQIPTSTKILGGHLDEDNNWVQSTQSVIADPGTGQQIPWGGVTQSSKPTSSLVTTAPGGANGEPIATTSTYIIKEGAPKGASATAYNPSTGRVEPTEWAQQVGVASVPITHFAAPQRTAAGQAAQSFKDAQAAYSAGNKAQGDALMSLYNAQQNDDKDAQAKIQAQIDSIKASDETKSIGKDPASLNIHMQQQLQQQVDMLKASKASPEAIQEAQSYLDAAKTRGSQLSAAAAAQTANVNSKTNLNNASSALKDAQATDVGGANAAKVTTAKIMAWSKAADTYTIGSMQPGVSPADKTEMIKNAQLLHSKIDAAQGAASGTQSSSTLSSGQQPTPDMIARLKANPADAAEFDHYWGAGAAEKILNSGPAQ